MKRRTLLIAAAAVTVIALLITIIVLRRPARRRPTAQPVTAASSKPVAEVTLVELPRDQWTPHIQALQGAGEWEALAEQLEQIRQKDPAGYAADWLGYLQARANIEDDEADDARPLLEPFLAAGHPLRSAALFHKAELEVGDENEAVAAQLRTQLLREFPDSQFVTDTIEDQLSYLEETANPEAMRQFAELVRARLDTGRRRRVDVVLAGSMLRAGRRQEAIVRASEILKSGVSDDAGEKAQLLLDQPSILPTLPPPVIKLVGEAARTHRHFDRAVKILELARARLPLEKDELTFSIGRSFFGNERYAEARQTYLGGAAAAKDAKAKATMLFHASRCAQLTGNDTEAEQLQTAAIAVPGRFPATAAALNQRLRTRLLRKRFAEAATDLQTLRKLFPEESGTVEAAIAVGMAYYYAGQSSAAFRTFDSIPPARLDPYGRTEVTYWKARSVEKSDPDKALELHLSVLRASVPTHFAYFSRSRVRSDALKLRAETLATSRAAASLSAQKSGDFNRARTAQTDSALLSSDGTKQLKVLDGIYREIPEYARVLTLEPEPLPEFGGKPLVERFEKLAAMGLFDDTSREIAIRFPIRSLSSSLTNSLLNNRAAESKASIYAAEVMMKRVPSDFVPQLLPDTVKQLLYPRYYYDFITEDSEKYDADPRLVLSIMREESRFNPRAKSEAAARGLLQFIITTARQVGRDLGLVDLEAGDLYDPRIIIQLGSKYIGSLLEQFGGNGYRTAAAYNAGPYQTRLWNRLAPSPDDDAFLSSINFEETKHYVRKVQNSYRRYGEIYDSGAAEGGLRAEP